MPEFLTFKETVWAKREGATKGVAGSDQRKRGPENGKLERAFAKLETGNVVNPRTEKRGWQVQLMPQLEKRKKTKRKKTHTHTSKSKNSNKKQ